MVFEFFTSWIDTILVLIKGLGYWGIFFGMMIESSFFPFPSEAIIIPAGALIAQGEMTIFWVFFAGTLGSLIGAMINFGLAFFLGRAFIDSFIGAHGKLFFLNKETLRNVDNYFKQHGEITTFLGRLIPVVRQLISLPAGFSKMNLFKFSFYTSFGAGIWVLILMVIGYFFGDNYSWINVNMDSIILSLLWVSLVVVIIYIALKSRKVKKIR